MAGTVGNGVPVSGPALEIMNVSKRFGGVRALKGVSMLASRGRVTCVMGENGAGKSTLMKVVAGVITPDEGQLRINGQLVERFDPRVAERAHGVSLVPQELDGFPDLSVERNLFAGVEPQGRALVDSKQLSLRAQSVLERVGLRDLDPGARFGSVSLAAQQMVVIGRALVRRCDVLVLDEPTAALTDVEVGILHGVIRSLCEAGSTVLYVSHRLQEVLNVADDIVVLRDGSVEARFEKGQADTAGLVKAMIGEAARPADRSGGLQQALVGSVRRGRHQVTATAGPGEPLVTASRVSAQGFTSLSCVVREGEVVGLAGLPDAGCTAVIRALFGDRRVLGGDLRVLGSSGGFKHPRDAIRAGVHFVSGDRAREGLFPNMSIAENMATLRLMSGGAGRHVVTRGRIRRIAQDAARFAPLQAADYGTNVLALSGGNQQKAIVDRVLVMGPRLILADEPTRGVDVGARRDIHWMVRQVADGGGAALVASSDWEELVSLCDSIVFMYRGRSVAQLEVDGGALDVSAMRRIVVTGEVPALDGGAVGA